MKHENNQVYGVNTKHQACILLPTVPAFDVHGRVEMGQRTIFAQYIYFIENVSESLCVQMLQ